MSANAMAVWWGLLISRDWIVHTFPGRISASAGSMQRILAFPRGGSAATLGEPHAVRSR
jgi:hypothetical protein